MSKAMFQGKEIEVIEIEVISCNEPWNEYQLADGTLLSIKTVVTSIAKAVNELTQDKEALYLVKSQNIVKAKPAK